MAKKNAKHEAKQYTQDGVYPNSSLVEVVCEIRFAPELSIECRRDEFYKKIKDRYPSILIPQLHTGQAASLEPYRFESVDKQSGVNLAINKFSFYSKKYQGHAVFMREFIRLAQILAEIYSLDKLIRIGWRYINIIPFTRENGLVPLNRFLLIQVKVPDGVPEEFENFSLAYISRVSGGSITTRIESIIRADNNQEALVLDFDFALTQNLRLTNLESYLHKAHDETRLLFENLITEQYRQYLRGESL